MVRKRNHDADAPKTVIPQLDTTLLPTQLHVPQGLDFSRYDFAQAGEPHRWSDYQIGEKIDHIDGVTIEDAEHMMATRLWQNTAKVHFDATVRLDGKRLILWWPRNVTGACAVVKRAGKCADDRRAKCRRACQPVLWRRYGARMV